MIAGPSLPIPDQTSAPERDLIPVRQLNEFAYCPRLGYLEWVQGEWAENLETLQGSFGHRNVDKPTRKQFEASDESTPADPIHARSLMLSAPGEGLIANLDLVELEGKTATPVDYKRGTVPDNDERSYEPERVQLCAQGLILRENGYTCTEGVLYFIASRQRVTIPFTDELIARTRELAINFRATAEAGRIPPPLVDSPKCPRCSLVGICLPDETNLLRSLDLSHSLDGDAPETAASTIEESPPAERVRRLIPARHDALPLYLQDHGLSLTKSGDVLVIKKKGIEIRKTRLKDISQVCVFGSAAVTEPALRELAIRGIPICHFTYGGWFYAQTTGLTHKNVELRLRQYAAAGDPGRALALSRQLVIGKIRNCRTLLRRHLESADKPKLLYQLNDYARKAAVCEESASLLGIEGMAAKVYFSGFARLLHGDDSFDIEGRNRRPPRDPVNALLSFLYSLLTKDLTVTVNAVGFDPYLGMYHQPRYGKPALALDLAEEFRPLIADSTVLTLINNREVVAGDFIRRSGAVTLTDAGRRAVMSAYERRLQSEITHPLFGYRISYRRLLEVQARLFARTVSGELPEYPAFTTR
jgi:CRISPR-associated protein Cas1